MESKGDQLQVVADKNNVTLAEAYFDSDSFQLFNLALDQPGAKEFVTTFQAERRSRIVADAVATSNDADHVVVVVVFVVVIVMFVVFGVVHRYAEGIWVYVE